MENDNMLFIENVQNIFDHKKSSKYVNSYEAKDDYLEQDQFLFINKNWVNNITINLIQT